MVKQNNVKRKERNTKPNSNKEKSMNIIKMIIIALLLTFGSAGITGWAEEECRDATGAPVKCEEDDSSADQPEPDTDTDGPNEEPEATGNEPSIVIDPEVEAFVVAMVERLQQEQNTTSDSAAVEALEKTIELLHAWNRSLQPCPQTADGDFNRDGQVNSADFNIWQNTTSDTDADAILDQLLVGCDPSLPEPEAGKIVAAVIEWEPDASTTETEIIALVLKLEFEVPSTGQTFEIDLLAFNNPDNTTGESICYLKYKLER